MNSLRAEADAAVLRAEEAEAKVKKLEQTLLEKDNDITSLQHKLALADETNEKLDEQLGQYKSSSLEGESSRTTSENLTRKVQLLEEELDVAEKNVKETVEKCVPFAMRRPCPVARRDVRSLTCAPRACVCLFTPG